MDKFVADTYRATSHVRMGRRIVEVEVVILDILAVIAFTIRQSKRSLLEYWIGTVPKCYCEAQKLLVVGESR